MLWHTRRKHNGIESFRLWSEKAQCLRFYTRQSSPYQHDTSVKVWLKKSFSVRSLEVIIFIDFITLAILVIIRCATLSLSLEASECFSSPTSVHFPLQPISPSQWTQLQTHIDLFVLQSWYPGSLVRQCERKKVHLLPPWSRCFGHCRLPQCKAAVFVCTGELVAAA